MNNGTIFLIETIFSLYMMVVILRIWLQLARADFFNPLSQFVVKVTNPPLKPLRRLIPSAGRLDTAGVVLLLLLSIINLLILVQLSSQTVPFSAVAIVAVRNVITITLQLMFWILIVRALMSWFSQGNNPMEMVFQQLTEPMLAPIRRIIPPIGGLDLSVLVLIILIQFLRVAIS